MSSFYDLPPLSKPADSGSVKFPAASYAGAAAYFDAYAEEIARAAKSIDPEALDRGCCRAHRGL